MKFQGFFIRLRRMQMIVVPFRSEKSEIAIKDTSVMYGMIVVPILTGCTIEEDWMKYFVSFRSDEMRCVE
jgi:hypothetical protein